MISTQKTGAYISQLRKKQNLTQAEMAAKLMVSPQAVSKWETGQALPDAEQLLTLSQLCGVPINTILLGGEEEQAAPVISAPEWEALAARQAQAGKPAAAGTPDTANIVKLAPFLDAQVLHEMIEQCPPNAFTLKQVIGLAPFVSPQALDRMTNHLQTALTVDQLRALAPFLSAERLGQLFANRAPETDGAVAFDDLVGLVPFLPRQVLKAELEAHPPRSFEELQKVVPFIDRETASQLARRLMGQA